MSSLEDEGVEGEGSCSIGGGEGSGKGERVEGDRRGGEGSGKGGRLDGIGGDRHGGVGRGSGGEDGGPLGEPPEDDPSASWLGLAQPSFANLI